MIVAIAKKTELKIVVIDKKIVMTTEKMHGIVKTIDQTIAMTDKMDDQTIVKIVVTEENKQLFTVSFNKNFILMKISRHFRVCSLSKTSLYQTKGIFKRSHWKL